MQIIKYYLRKTIFQMKEDKDLKNSMHGMKQIDHQEAEEEGQKKQQKIQQFVNAFEDFLNDC